MKSYFCLSMPRWAKLLVAVGGICLTGAARVDASCGDHTWFSLPTFETAPSPSQANPTNSPHNVTRSVARNATTALPCGPCAKSPGVPRDVPCRGAHCSNQPAPDAVPVTGAPINKTLELWTLCPFAMPDAPQTEGWLVFVDFLGSMHRSNPIYHPPRHF